MSAMRHKYARHSDILLGDLSFQHQVTVPPITFSVTKIPREVDGDSLSSDKMTLLKRQLQRPTRNDMAIYSVDRTTGHEHKLNQSSDHESNNSYQSHPRKDSSSSLPRSSPSPNIKVKGIEVESASSFLTSQRFHPVKPDQITPVFSPQTETGVSFINKLSYRPGHISPHDLDTKCDSTEDTTLTKTDLTSVLRQHEQFKPAGYSPRKNFLQTPSHMSLSDFSMSFPPPHFHLSSSMTSSSPNSASSSSPVSTLMLSNHLPMQPSVSMTPPQNLHMQPSVSMTPSQNLSIQPSSLFPISFTATNIPNPVLTHSNRTTISPHNAHIPFPSTPSTLSPHHQFSPAHQEKQLQEPNFPSRKRRHSSGPIPVDPSIPFTTYLHNLTRTLQEAARRKSASSVRTPTSLNGPPVACILPHPDPDSRLSVTRGQPEPDSSSNENQHPLSDRNYYDTGDDVSEKDERENGNREDVNDTRSIDQYHQDDNKVEGVTNIDESNTENSLDDDDDDDVDEYGDNLQPIEKDEKLDAPWPQYKPHHRNQRERRMKRQRHKSEIYISSQDDSHSKQGKQLEPRHPQSAPVFTFTPPASLTCPSVSLCHQYLSNHRSPPSSPHHHHHLTVALSTLPLHMAHPTPPPLSQFSPPTSHFLPSNIPSMYSKLFTGHSTQGTRFPDLSASLPGLGTSPHGPASRFPDLSASLGGGGVIAKGISSISARIGNYFTPSLLGLGSLSMRRASADKPPPVKKYKCDICQKAFSRSNTLVTHKRIHTGDKPFKCEICGRAFRQPGNLTRHRLTHTTHKPYVCHVCGKAFNRASNLNTHIRTHSSFRHFGCSVCPKTSFQNKADINGERSYDCDICGRCFPHTSTLLAHRRTHTL